MLLSEEELKQRLNKNHEESNRLEKRVDELKKKLGKDTSPIKIHIGEPYIRCRKTRKKISKSR
jgi:hypothetical protein